MGGMFSCRSGKTRMSTPVVFISNTKSWLCLASKRREDSKQIPLLLFDIELEVQATIKGKKAQKK